MLKILVTGSRDLNDETVVYEALGGIDGWFHNEEITLIHGGARGADSLAADVAGDFGWNVKPPYLPDWTMYGKAAGPIRNREMLDLENPDLVLAFWNGTVEHSGTLDMIKRANSKGKLVFVFPVQGCVPRVL